MGEKLIKKSLFLFPLLFFLSFSLLISFAASAQETPPVRPLMPDHAEGFRDGHDGREAIALYLL